MQGAYVCTSTDEVIVCLSVCLFVCVSLLLFFSCCLSLIAVSIGGDSLDTFHSAGSWYMHAYSIKYVAKGATHAMTTKTLSIPKGFFPSMYDGGLSVAFIPEN